MKKLIDWLVERVVMYRGDTLPEPTTTAVIRAQDLEEALGKVELPDNHGIHKCAYRRLVEDLEVDEATPKPGRLSKCYECLGYIDHTQCPDYVSIDELTKFLEIFRDFDKPQAI